MPQLETRLISTIKNLLDQARKQVFQTVNTTMVKTYFEIGKTIIEDEQNGENRAQYGKEILKNLSVELTKEYGKGFSVDNLENMRRFYLAYEKSETLSRKSQKDQIVSGEFLEPETSSSKFADFKLSWSHYLILTRMDSLERAFYEKEIGLGNWSVREFQRQIDSSLFERVTLSRNKTAVLQESLQKYHQPESSKDIIKDPMVSSFWG